MLILYWSALHRVRYGGVLGVVDRLDHSGDAYHLYCYTSVHLREHLPTNYVGFARPNELSRRHIKHPIYSISGIIPPSTMIHLEASRRTIVGPRVSAKSSLQVPTSTSCSGRLWVPGWGLSPIPGNCIIGPLWPKPVMKHVLSASLVSACKFTFVTNIYPIAPVCLCVNHVM